jgi:hypothetical protein
MNQKIFDSMIIVTLEERCFEAFYFNKYHYGIPKVLEAVAIENED